MRVRRSTRRVQRYSSTDEVLGGSEGSDEGQRSHVKCRGKIPPVLKSVEKSGAQRLIARMLILFAFLHGRDGK